MFFCSRSLKLSTILVIFQHTLLLLSPLTSQGIVADETRRWRQWVDLEPTQRNSYTTMKGWTNIEYITTVQDSRKQEWFPSTWVHKSHSSSEEGLIHEACGSIVKVQARQKQNFTHPNNLQLSFSTDEVSDPSWVWKVWRDPTLRKRHSVVWLQM